MPKITDHELVNGLVVGTEEGRIDWQLTGSAGQFTASFGGKWTLLFTQRVTSDREIVPVLEVQNSEGETLLRLTRFQDDRIPDLYETARRRALKIDEALADLLKEINSPQK